METETMVKRVIDGKAYNTDTSELIARACDLQPSAGEPYDVRMYRTRGGAYFAAWTDFRSNNHQGINPLSRERAKAIAAGKDDQYRGFKFNVLGNADELLVDIPEAKAGDEPSLVDQESVIFFRVSRIFKVGVEKAAKDAGLSVNAWLLRATEKELRPEEIRIEKEQLLFRVENTIDFRDRKAQEYPMDNRNAKSAEALRGLCAHISGLPNDHPLFDALDLVSHSTAGESAYTEFSEELSQDMSRYGFDGTEDHGRFVDQLIVTAARTAIKFYENSDD